MCVCVCVHMHVCVVAIVNVNVEILGKKALEGFFQERACMLKKALLPTLTVVTTVM